MPNQDAPRVENALRISARLPRAFEIAFAAPAQSFAVHVCPVVPAPLAFRIGARFHVHLGRTIGAMRGCTRRDEHILELVAKPCNRVVYRAGRPDVELRCEWRADLLLLASFLDCLGGRLAELAHGAPALDLRLLQLRVGDFVPGALEDARVATAREYLPGFLGGKTEDRRHQAHQAMGDVEE